MLPGGAEVGRRWWLRLRVRLFLVPGLRLTSGRMVWVRMMWIRMLLRKNLIRDSSMRYPMRAGSLPHVMVIVTLTWVQATQLSHGRRPTFRSQADQSLVP